MQLVGDDLFVTNPSASQRGIDGGVANAILVKVNQIGTLSETLDAIALAATQRLRVGHVAPLGRDRGHRRSPTSRSRRTPARSRPGAPSRSDRVAKYNQLLRIEEELGTSAIFPGRRGVPRAGRAARLASR